jgi:hypothetical protein
MGELTKLTEYCRNLGATPQQAAVMAQQLLKRADQLSVERNQSREECMAYLLRLVAQGNAGQVPPEFSSPKEPGSPAQNNASKLPK